MASGMGLTMTPMTELIMSSVPRDKAGVGSAMNDTTREVGTTLGVAVLGSILSSGYTSNLGRVVAALPAPARQTAEGSLAGALGVAHEIGGAQGAAIVDAAKSAWADGLQLSMLIGAGIVLVAAAIAARYLPGKLGGATDEAIDLDGFDRRARRPVTGRRRLTANAKCVPSMHPVCIEVTHFSASRCLP